MIKHLIFVQHGLFGMSYFFDNFKQTLENSIADSVVILPHQNNSVYSMFGTVTCGTKLAIFIESTLKQYPNAETISFVGHSFGGIINRYAIGMLEIMGIFDKVKPLAYISISTPHMGVTTNSSAMKFALKHFIGETGKDLIMNTNVLKEISDPNSNFMIGLSKFKLKLLYGNLFNDTVIYETACLCEKIDGSNVSLTEIVPKRLYLLNESTIKSNINSDLIGEFSDLKKLDWIKKVADLSEYFNSHITIVGRHTFIPFLTVKKDEGKIVVDDIANEIVRHVV